MQRTGVWLKASALVLITTIIAGCGFKLRGALDVPIAATELRLTLPKNTPDAFEHFLMLTIAEQGIRITGDADYQIKIDKIYENRRSITLDEKANVDEYELLKLVSFEILDREEKVIATKLQARTERIYDYDADAATASLAQEQQIQQEMWQTLSTRILRQYIAQIRQLEATR